MRYVRSMYVEFHFPGAFTSDCDVREVGNRDVSVLKVPSGVFAFQYFDVVSAEVLVDGERVRLTSGRINESPMYYYGGTLYTLNEFKRAFPDKVAEIDTLERGGYARVRCEGSSMLPLEEGDVFLPAREQC